MDVRAVNEYDAAEILELIYEHFPYVQIDFDSLVKRIHHPAFLFHKSVENENLTGFAEWQVIHPQEKTVQLNGIVVKPWYQGKGYGNQLMNEGEKWAKRTGMKKIQLLVAQSNEGAQKLYAQNGYHFVRMNPQKINGELTEVWEKPINR